MDAKYDRGHATLHSSGTGGMVKCLCCSLAAFNCEYTNVSSRKPVNMATKRRCAPAKAALIGSEHEIGTIDGEGVIVEVVVST